MCITTHITRKNKLVGHPHATAVNALQPKCSMRNITLHVMTILGLIFLINRTYIKKMWIGNTKAVAGNVIDV